jgi:hypothetical protein
MEQIFEQSKIFLKENMELFFLVMGIFFVVSSWFNWNRIFNPPYNSIKNPIGFFLGRTAMRIEFFIAGIFIIALSLLLLYLKL